MPRKRNKPIHTFRPEVLSERFNARKHKLDLTYQDIAQKSGLCYRTVFNFSTGCHDPQTSSLVGIARALEVSVGWLVGVES